MLIDLVEIMWVNGDWILIFLIIFGVGLGVFCGCFFGVIWGFMGKW